MRAGHLSGKRADKARRLICGERVGCCRQPLVGRNQLEAMAAVIEPDSQADISVLKNTRRHRRHIRQLGIAEQNRVKPFGHRQGHSSRRFRSSRGTAVIAPVSERAIGIHQRELKLAVAVEVDSPDGDASLMIEQLRHRGRQRERQARDGEDEMAKKSKDGIHINWAYSSVGAFGRGGGVMGSRPELGAEDDGGVFGICSGAPGRKPSPESVA